MKTYSPKPRDIERRWYVIDASGAVLGRLASEVAAVLRGKHKPIFAPHMDTGDHVIVVNAAEVRLTGGKEEKKIAYRHSGYPGGLTETTYARLLARKPAYAVEKAIRGMLPKNRLGRAMAKKLQVYGGPTHRHAAQKPEPLKLGEVPKWEGLPRPETKAAKAEKIAPEPTAPKRRAATKPDGRPAQEKPVAKPAKTTAPKAATAERTTAKATTAKRTTAKATTAKSTAKATAKSPAKRMTARKAKKGE